MGSIGLGLSTLEAYTPIVCMSSVDHLGWLAIPGGQSLWGTSVGFVQTTLLPRWHHVPIWKHRVSYCISADMAAEIAAMYNGGK
jgi:hypothetical protein